MSRELDAKARTCAECGGERPAKNRQFCSKRCRRKNRWCELVCNHCGRGFSALRNEVERGQHKFCSHLCSELASRSRPAVEHCGVRYALNAQGYYRAQHPERLLHRVIWEEANGPIPNGFIVHHKNGIKTDNSLGNLDLIEWGEHSSEHNRERWARRSNEQVA